jgi:hypothetical protein
VSGVEWDSCSQLPKPRLDIEKAGEGFTEANQSVTTTFVHPTTECLPQLGILITGNV